MYGVNTYLQSTPYLESSFTVSAFDGMLSGSARITLTSAPKALLCFKISFIS